MKMILKIFEHEKLILTQSLDKGVYRLGRSEFSDIVISDPKLARSALEFRVTENSLYVTNMGQPGQLKINGKKQETGQLNEGATLELATYKIAMILGDEEPLAEKNKVEADRGEPEVAKENIVASDNGGFNEGGIFGNDPMAAFNTPADSDNSPEGLAPKEEPKEIIDREQNVVEFPDASPQVAQSDSPYSEGNLALKEKTDTVGKPLVAKIIFFEGPRAGEEIPLQSFELSFGRSAKADVVIADKKLSRVHAKIIRFGTGYRVIDLNSHNGTRVNGVRILEHPLSSYDVIEFGDNKIKFLIHDLILNEKSRSTNLMLASISPKDPTKSLVLEEAERLEISRLRREKTEAGENLVDVPEAEEETQTKPKSPIKILLVVIIAVGLSLWLMSNNPETQTKKKTETVITPPSDSSEKSTIVPKIPRDFAELSEDMQRRIEGYYSTALSLSQRAEVSLEELEKAREDLRKIHQSLPYYKNSRELLDQIERRYRSKLDQMAAEKAKKDAVQDLNLYLEDGIEYLKQGEFDRAAESFTLALNLDPRNPVAIKGLKAAEVKSRDLENLPVEKDPEEEKRQLIKELYDKALQELNNRAYQEAIDLAEKIRKINLKSDQTYLNEAKQIIDRARMAQKDEFEPFLLQAKEKFSEGDYNASRDLCEEMLKRDPAYEDAKELLGKAKKQLNRLAKEAYTHGYILESIGQIEQAKQYWNRAKNYVRSGDEYFDKVNKKLDQYQ